ncbi:TetR/AcrR family transcriptional regulator [Paracoccus siganidrum]|uniref:TetR/AcrR family transcriptional regulator n=1 Tax=Paracoccus siganidrum TaxID=1276757 RepID=A0A419A6S0_9RHOB|nr:TetR/AcrR family transcriptional regulator [Paracoccus siganidrum]RJL16301.1 TetR/AcrR family transcriptional regulator [Paracoccus siganidrum]RMC40585.1 hypothetical protein C9E82_02735 [Paracoccus siganidrum]
MSSQDSRRVRTLKRIQATAIRLAIAEGLNNITTETIAREAGISTRTFFNYYPYKEAAIMGPPPDYPAEAAERFVAGRGRLIDDLHMLIAAHLGRFVEERDLVADMLRLSETDQKLLALRQNAVLARRAQLSEMLRRRMPTIKPAMAEILAAAIVAATNTATVDWAMGAREDFLEAARENLDMILPAATMLTAKAE